MSDALFCALLKFWRRKRGLSQLDLALTAGVSARHLSFLESGRARPSEEMVLRLLSVLAVPLRDQNEVLRAAAFSPRFPEAGLENLPPPLDFALTHMLRQHAPYPMTVMNAGYQILRANPAAEAIFGRFLVHAEHLAGPLNLLALVFDPNLLRPFIENWASVAQQLLIRLHREALARPGDARLGDLLRQVMAYPGVPRAWREPDFSIESAPTLTLRLARESLALQFFTTLTVFSAPQQAGLDELRIESYFPMDAQTAQTCEALLSGA